MGEYRSMSECGYNRNQKPKWLYRLESTDVGNGLWYNEKGEFVFGIDKVENCPSKYMPMGYDERYLQDGKHWFSACSKKEDLMHWFSVENAEELMSQGFKFYTYLVVDYHEYDKETVFLKETVLDKVELSIRELFAKR